MANAELHNQRATFGNLCEQYEAKAREIQRTESAKLREQEIHQLNQREALVMEMRSKLMSQTQSSAQLQSIEHEMEFRFMQIMDESA